MQSQMRMLLVDRLQRSHGLKLQRGPCAAPSPMRSAADSLIAEYLTCSKMPYSLAVFQPESGLTALLSQAEILELLHTEPGSTLGLALEKRCSLASLGALCDQPHA